MPVTTSYPGVYIEEIPSGVRTLTGVATSITAFVGFTSRGPVNRALRIFSFADFEREFGGLALDSPLSYCVRHFFQNGGTDAYVVRAAQNAAAASVVLQTAGAAPVPTLTVSAISEGTWGNNLQIDIDYDTTNPASFFNFRVTEFVISNGLRVPGRSEVFRNLSMDNLSTNYALALINGNSALVRVTSTPVVLVADGNSISGIHVASPVVPPGGYRFLYTLNGRGPFEAVVSAPRAPLGVGLNFDLDAIGLDIEAAIALQQTPGVTYSLVGGNQLMFEADTDATHPIEQSSIHFLDAPTGSINNLLLLGQSQGGTETDGSAPARPAQNGTVGTTGTATVPPVIAGNVDLIIDFHDGAGGSLATTPSLLIWDNGALPQPTTLAQMVAQINTALTAAATTEPRLAGAVAQVIGNNMVRVLPGTANSNLSFAFTGALAGPLSLAAAGARNLARYAPGVGVTALAQVQGTPGNNGTPPLPATLTGNMAAKTGMYALEDVDLFNLLVIPEASAGAGATAVISEAIAYCVRRRAFMIIDAPESITTFAAASAWIGGPGATFSSRNAALYFPRIREPDPLMGGTIRTSPAAGALAGIYARTDGERGVWKAPAGISATVLGATGLLYTLTDAENGVLNPLALNCLRTFPVIGTVAWGARTSFGADIRADEYKYIPVRRLALFLEESLYRGTQWVVFEPNDEPLWAQIRLNLGAFMNTLFSQGAFQGRTPREAYFVKCDKETTTQNDINLGRVNIVVGFAPLKPAEFVIIQIQQIAGAIKT